MAESIRENFERIEHAKPAIRAAFYCCSYGEQAEIMAYLKDYQSVTDDPSRSRRPSITAHPR